MKVKNNLVCHNVNCSSFDNEEKCNNNNFYSWKNSTCTENDCSSFTTKNTCNNNNLCSWKNSKCTTTIPKCERYQINNWLNSPNYCNRNINDDYQISDYGCIHDTQNSKCYPTTINNTSKLKGNPTVIWEVTNPIYNNRLCPNIIISH